MTKARDTGKTTGNKALAGRWRGELVSTCSVTFGSTQQEGPTKQVAELSYITAPLILWPLDGPETAGVLMIAAPPRPEPVVGPGFILGMRDSPTLMVSLTANRRQFSDIVAYIKSSLLRTLLFNVAELDADGQWLVSDWSLTGEVRNR